MILYNYTLNIKVIFQCVIKFIWEVLFMTRKYTIKSERSIKKAIRKAEEAKQIAVRVKDIADIIFEDTIKIIGHDDAMDAAKDLREDAKKSRSKKESKSLQKAALKFEQAAKKAEQEEKEEKYEVKNIAGAVTEVFAMINEFIRKGIEIKKIYSKAETITDGVVAASEEIVETFTEMLEDAEKSEVELSGLRYKSLINAAEAIEASININKIAKEMMEQANNMEKALKQGPQNMELVDIVDSISESSDPDDVFYHEKKAMNKIIDERRVEIDHLKEEALKEKYHKKDNHLHHSKHRHHHSKYKHHIKEKIEDDEIEIVSIVEASSPIARTTNFTLNLKPQKIEYEERDESISIIDIEIKDQELIDKSNQIANRKASMQKHSASFKRIDEIIEEDVRISSDHTEKYKKIEKTYDAAINDKTTRIDSIKHQIETLQKTLNLLSKAENCFKSASSLKLASLNSSSIETQTLSTDDESYSEFDLTDPIALAILSSQNSELKRLGESEEEIEAAFPVDIS